MVSKPKPCKHGCGTIITWNEGQRFFQGPDGQKHDCRDWPGVGGGSQQQGSNNSVNFTSGPSPQQAQETLIGVQAKKTWENYFKHLEAINPNLVSIHSESQTTNGLLGELVKAVKDLNDTVTLLNIKSGNISKEGEKDDK
jgi:hypothetical protein